MHHNVDVNWVFDFSVIKSGLSVHNDIFNADVISIVATLALQLVCCIDSLLLTSMTSGS